MRHCLYSRRYYSFFAIVVLNISVYLFSCASSTIFEKLGGVPEEKLILNAGDEIEIKFQTDDELNEIQIIRPDGHISLLLLGDVKIAGLSIPEVHDTLLTLYKAANLREDIEFVVIARNLYSNIIHVGGEVNTPGLVNMTGSITALEAIMQAGGFNLATAAIKDVVIIRHENGMRYADKFDLSGPLKGKDTRPFYLKPHDIVYVPRTRVVSVLQWVDQNIFSLIPPGFIYTFPVGEGGTFGINTAYIVR